MPVDDIDFVDATWILGQTPVSRQRLIEKLEQYCTIHAVVGDGNNRILGMMRQEKSQRVGGSSNEILQRFPIGEAYEMRRREPRGKKLRIGVSHLFVTPELPHAIVDVVEFVEDAGFDVAGFGNRRAGRNASGERARVDRARAPRGSDPPGDGVSLRSSAFGQDKVRATAKPLRIDTFDVPMADEENLGHPRTPSA